MKKLSLILIALLAVSMFLGACQQATPVEPTDAPATAEPEEPAEPEATEEPEPTAEPEPVEMFMTWWGSQARHDATIKVIDMFTEEHPNITITNEFSSFGDYWTLMATKASGGTLPCVMQQDYAYYRDYVANEQLIPLDPYIDDGTIDLTNVSDDAIDGGRVDGQLYALSLGTNSQSFVIDLDMFEEAGVEVPADDWTWEDFEEINMKLHEELDIFGNGGGLENPQILNALYLSLGQGLYAEDGKSLGFTDTQPLLDYFSMMVRLQEAGAMPTREQTVANPPTLENNALVTKEAAMYFAHTNQIVALWKAAGEDRNLQMVPVPRAVGATQPANYYKPSMFFSITSQCETPKEAAMFIDYFTNNIDANKVLLAERGVPISSAVQEALKPEMTKSQLASFDFLEALANNVSPIRPPDPAAHNDIQTNVYVPLVLDPMMFGQITPEKAVETFVTEANKILSGE